jgi:hypothetical protein
MSLQSNSEEGMLPEIAPNVRLFYFLKICVLMNHDHNHLLL